MNHDGTLQILIHVFVGNGALDFSDALTIAVEPLRENETVP